MFNINLVYSNYGGNVPCSIGVVADPVDLPSQPQRRLPWYNYVDIPRRRDVPRSTESCPQRPPPRSSIRTRSSVPPAHIPSHSESLLTYGPAPETHTKENLPNGALMLRRGNTVQTFHSCTKCLGSPGILVMHNRRSDCHLVIWASIHLNMALIRKLLGSLMCLANLFGM